MSWAPDYYDRAQRWDWPYTGYLNLGPVRIPPLVPFTGMVDRVTGQTWYIGHNASQVVLQSVQPAAVNIKVYQPFDGPWLPYQTRLGVSNGVLVFDQNAGGNASAPVWIYNVANPLEETWPEPTNIPALLPVPVPGVPSSSPAPTGGGFKAFNDQMPGGSKPPYLTIILAGPGLAKNLAWWNGAAWVSPAGNPIFQFTLGPSALGGPNPLG